MIIHDTLMAWGRANEALLEYMEKGTEDRDLLRCILKEIGEAEHDVWLLIKLLPECEDSVTLGHLTLVADDEGCLHAFDKRHRGYEFRYGGQFSCDTRLVSSV